MKKHRKKMRRKKITSGLLNNNLCKQGEQKGVITQDSKGKQKTTTMKLTLLIVLLITTSSMESVVMLDGSEASTGNITLAWEKCEVVRNVTRHALEQYTFARNATSAFESDDVRNNYKQTSLGLLYALLDPQNFAFSHEAGPYKGMYYKAPDSYARLDDALSNLTQGYVVNPPRNETINPFFIIQIVKNVETQLKQTIATLWTLHFHCKDPGNLPQSMIDSVEVADYAY